MAAAHRHHVQRRRRDILMALIAGMGGSFLLGMVHGLRVMLLVNVVLDVMFVAYVSILIRLRSLAAEREVKLMFLPEAQPVAARAPTRGRPAYRQRDMAGDDYEQGYGEAPAVLMRRAN